jgi:hypothetical protein
MRHGLTQQPTKRRSAVPICALMQPVSRWTAAADHLAAKAVALCLAPRVGGVSRGTTWHFLQAQTGIQCRAFFARREWQALHSSTTPTHRADAPQRPFCPDGMDRPAGEPSLFLQSCASRTDHAAAMCLLQTTYQPSLTAPVCPSLQSEPHANDCTAPHCLHPLYPTQHLPPNHGLTSQAHGDCQSTGRCTGYTRAHWQHTSDHVSR